MAPRGWCRCPGVEHVCHVLTSARYPPYLLQRGKAYSHVHLGNQSVRTAVGSSTNQCIVAVTFRQAWDARQSRLRQSVTVTVSHWYTCVSTRTTLECLPSECRSACRRCADAVCAVLFCALVAHSALHPSSPVACSIAGVEFTTDTAILSDATGAQLCAAAGTAAVRRRPAASDAIVLEVGQQHRVLVPAQIIRLLNRSGVRFSML